MGLSLAFLSRRSGVATTLVQLAAAAAVVILASGSRSADAHARQDFPPAISDADFWKFFTNMSEPGGSFVSENFVSNEVGFQNVIPTLQKKLTPNGVYLGVGPEQNFTYIVNLKPRLAVIFDIRRQNAMQHLMYKALIEASPTRAEFVSKLFSRPMSIGKSASASARELFDAVNAAAPNDSAFAANSDFVAKALTLKHGFALSPTDLGTIAHVYQVFYEKGPDINYSSRLGYPNRINYATYSSLQSIVGPDSVMRAFLASEDNYRMLREMQVRNLIVPVVGDFGGPSAIRAVGAYLRERKLVVSAFYLSNVEQYLFQNDAAHQFYENVATLPIDSASTFIRSVPRSGGMIGGGMPMNFGNFGAGMGGSGGGTFTITPSGGYSMSIDMRDSAGYRIIRTTTDSGGKPVTKTVIDSSRMSPTARLDSLASKLDSLMFPGGVVFRSRDSTAIPFTALPRMMSAMPNVNMAGSLTSGIASISRTLTAFKQGSIFTYRDVIGDTKVDGWK